MVVLSDLDFGEIVRIKESGQYQDYIVVGRGTHGTGENDTLVIRRDLLFPTTYFYATAEYANSTPDLWLSFSYIAALESKIRTAIKPATLSCWDEFHKEQKTIKRQCFLLSATEFGFTDATYFAIEGTAVPYFSTAASRVALHFGVALPYGTRTAMKSSMGNSVHIIAVGSDGEWSMHAVMLYQLLVRPAMILDGSLEFDDYRQVIG